MRPVPTLLAFMSLVAPLAAAAQPSDPRGSALTLRELGQVSPALERYGQQTLLNDVWKRPGLSPRDRSLVTVAVLVARNQPVEMPSQVERALANGVTPAELSELVTHLAFYSGWGNAQGAAVVLRDAFARRGIGPDQLPPASPELLPVDRAADAERASGVERNVGPVSPNLARDTNGVLFDDLWRRPGLAPRDRSLATVSSLIASGQVAQVGYHLGRAIDNGLTQGEASELISHIAYYAGWPNAFSAVPVAQTVFDGRKK